MSSKNKVNADLFMPPEEYDRNRISEESSSRSVGSSLMDSEEIEQLMINAVDPRKSKQSRPLKSLKNLTLTPAAVNNSPNNYKTKFDSHKEHMDMVE